MTIREAREEFKRWKVAIIALLLGLAAWFAQAEQARLSLGIRDATALGLQHESTLVKLQSLMEFQRETLIRIEADVKAVGDRVDGIDYRMVDTMRENAARTQEILNLLRERSK